MIQPQRIYYLRWIDPKTGFPKREEFTSRRTRAEREEQLKDQGVKHISKGSYVHI